MLLTRLLGLVRCRNLLQYRSGGQSSAVGSGYRLAAVDSLDSSDSSGSDGGSVVAAVAVAVVMAALGLGCFDYGYLAVDHTTHMRIRGRFSTPDGPFSLSRCMISLSRMQNFPFSTPK